MCFIKEVAESLEKIHPLERADHSWDNVGILLEFTSTERKVLLCIDLTHQVLDECEALGVSSVVAYHPVIFSPIKQINQSTPLLYRCINMGLSVYTPHTALDGASNGINAWLGSLIPKTEIVDTVGFIQVFKNQSTIKEILVALSTALSLGCVRYALAATHTLDSLPEQIATGAGSSARSLKKLAEEVPGEKESTRALPSLVITGEASHHDLLFLNRSNVSAIILEHSRSERGFLQRVKEHLEEDTGAEVLVSAADSDPVLFFMK
ncbi:hypothetical protein NEDG_00473 [Nematocida displodere]|uniref:YbgI/family dinuclear metal center protein n=1 Tax=Nematocida displodere TaxID=1805483 RepID=A0A177EJF0_9MICR|nr:hypothetical protein NEDG_00473 [Nematocida displodere]